MFHGSMNLREVPILTWVLVRDPHRIRPKKKTQKELEEEEEEQEGRRERDQCPTKQLLLLRFDNRLR